MEFVYHTIRQKTENILLKEKGSKFIGFAYPVASEEDVRIRLDEIVHAHPKATHHCYAYRLGLNGEHYRANDDGEPSGSAGLPIYNQLLAHQITNVLVVVVRYFGGTKLGVGGLVKTYKESAKLTLDTTEIVTRELQATFHIIFDYPQQNTVFTLLSKNDAKILDFEASEKCHIKAQIKRSQKGNISEQMSRMHYLSFQFEE